MAAWLAACLAGHGQAGARASEAAAPRPGAGAAPCVASAMSACGGDDHASDSEDRSPTNSALTVARRSSRIIPQAPTKREGPVAPDDNGGSQKKKGRNEAGWIGQQQHRRAATTVAGAAAGVGAAQPKLGDRVRCWFKNGPGEGEEGTVSCLGQHSKFKVSYEGTEWNEWVKVSDYGVGFWTYALATMPLLPAAKSETDMLGEHVLMLSKGEIVAQGYTASPTTSKGVRKLAAPFYLEKRVRGVVTAHDPSTDTFTVEVPQEPSVVRRTLNKRQLNSMLWRGLPEAVKNGPAKKDRLLFCKWKNVAALGQPETCMRMHGLTEVLGGGYLHCLPGFTYTWTGRGTLRKFKPGQVGAVEAFIAVSTRVHSMAPRMAGLAGSIFFEGLAPELEAYKVRGTPINVFVCHHQECKARWEYCGRYQVANEDSYREDTDLSEGADGHGDVWDKVMSDDARDEYARSAAKVQGGWGAQRYVDAHPSNKHVAGREWSSLSEEERKTLIKKVMGG